MDDLVIARIRTWWPLFLGHIASLLVIWLAKAIGLELDTTTVTVALGLILSAAIWELGRRLERSDNPVADAIGRWLLALGGAVGPPKYGAVAATSSRPKPPTS